MEEALIFFIKTMIFLLWGCICFLIGSSLSASVKKDQLRQKLRQAIKQCHGGGNGRRLLEEVLNDV